MQKSVLLWHFNYFRLCNLATHFDLQIYLNRYNWNLFQNQQFNFKPASHIFSWLRVEWVFQLRENFTHSSPSWLSQKPVWFGLDLDFGLPQAIGLIHLAAILVLNASRVMELTSEFQPQFHPPASAENQVGIKMELRCVIAKEENKLIAKSDHHMSDVCSCFRKEVFHPLPLLLLLPLFGLCCVSSIGDGCGGIQFICWTHEIKGDATRHPASSLRITQRRHGFVSIVVCHATYGRCRIQCKTVKYIFTVKHPTTIQIGLPYTFYQATTFSSSSGQTRFGQFFIHRRPSPNPGCIVW